MSHKGERTLHLEDLREKKPNYNSKPPFPHQTEAFECLTKNFTFPITNYRGGILVLPTGGGKTFTAVNWICRNVLPKKIKVIWFAQSSYLLEQACRAFQDNALDIINRKTINVRVVSSSPDNAKCHTILPTDDIIIITTQTAIANFTTSSTDLNGNIIESEFKKLIKNSAEAGLFVVLDEAHHAPAYGFRTLWKGIHKLVTKFYILGLTATPTHNDPRIGGWLFKIFDNGILYRAKQSELIAQKILAVPHYIEKKTGKELVVDDALYEQLVIKHKEPGKEIIEMLAKDSARNDYIINDYIENKNDYGKTIIFADSKEQCSYFKVKLREKGVNADTVFTKILDSK
jgi:superfamily II DNA or RNA helicase